MPLLTASRSIWFPVVLLLVAMVSIQTGAALAKTLFPALGAVGVSALRLGLAALLLCVIMRPWRGGWPGLHSCRSLLVYGLALGGMNMLFYQALERVPLGIAVALEFTGPLAVALCSSRRVLDVVWVALVALGLWLLLPVGATQAPIDPLGAAFALAAGGCWALYIIYGRKAGTDHGSRTVALGTVVAALMAMPIGVAQLGSELFVPALLPVALAVAVLSTALPYSLEMVALRRMPSRTFSMLMSLEPAVAAMSGLIFLSERLTPLQWLAVLSIIVAAAGAAQTSRPMMAKRAER
ncbi:threonine/homoserine exporter RhtA [Halotalea alkalilenta]|uniref:Transporter n=1 Tax=Halotalea alkalilenta TaxID=376489 RepID=A0A172YH46_9GAMM|nr:threonine/homoserine exporter RhtA [Halotalea alkalilenta]ANF58580.1 transporter [Halotalea alkalilenta]